MLQNSGTQPINTTLETGMNGIPRELQMLTKIFLTFFPCQDLRYSTRPLPRRGMGRESAIQLAAKILRAACLGGVFKVLKYICEDI